MMTRDFIPADIKDPEARKAYMQVFNDGKDAAELIAVYEVRSYFFFVRFMFSNRTFDLTHSLYSTLIDRQAREQRDHTYQPSFCQGPDEPSPG